MKVEHVGIFKKKSSVRCPHKTELVLPEQMHCAK